MRNSNDNLLCHIIATDEMSKGAMPKHKVDELHHNPTQIEIGANEAVYLHFLHVNAPTFALGIRTATRAYDLTEANTIDGSFNTIVRCLSDVKFKVDDQTDFFVQLIRIQY